jgi:hypothetical protein
MVRRPPLELPDAEARAALLRRYAGRDGGEQQAVASLWPHLFGAGLSLQQLSLAQRLLALAQRAAAAGADAAADAATAPDDAFRALLHHLVYFHNQWHLFEQLGSADDVLGVRRLGLADFVSGCRVLGIGRGWSGVDDGRARLEFAAICGGAAAEKGGGERDGGGNAISFDAFCVYCAR